MALSNATAKTLKEVMPQLGKFRNIGTSTLPKMNPSYAPAMGGEATQPYPYASTTSVSHRRKSLKEELLPKGKPMGDYVPVYVALGMIGLSVSLGLYTAKQELLHAPDVRVKKSRRETLPEVVEPEHVAHESEEFVNKSLFRKVGHVQDAKTPVAVFTPGGSTLIREHRVESLKTVGVEP